MDLNTLIGHHRGKAFDVNSKGEKIIVDDWHNNAYECLLSLSNKNEGNYVKVLNPKRLHDLDNLIKRLKEVKSLLKEINISFNGNE